MFAIHWRFVRRIGLAGLMSACAAHAAALGFDEALRLAQERSRQLPAHEAATTAAREMAVAARQLPDPTLKAGVSNLPINGPDQFSLTRDFMTMRNIGLMQEFTRGDKRAARAARFEREAEAAQASRALALTNLQRDTAIAWLDRHYAERMRALLAAQRDESRLQVDAAEAAYRGNRGAQADVFAARSAVAQIDDRLAQTERQLAGATTQLARWVGAAAAQPLDTPPAMTSIALQPAELDTTLAHHPQIAVMFKQEEIALADAEVARANRHADWSAELMLSQRGPAYSNMVSLTVALPLQWDTKNRQDRELAAKLATAEQMRAEREEATRAHVAEARAMLQEWHSNGERLQRYDASILPLAAQRTQAALSAYRGGSGPLTAVLDARRNDIDMRMERLRLEMDTARLWAQLNFLVPASHAATTP